ncbi:putative lipid II flippase FtsW, partial [Candidatus Zixiibacteriota bacterium]
MTSRKRKKRRSHQSLVRTRGHVMQPAAQMDRTILTLVLLLVGLGTVMVYSASSAVAASQFGDSAWYLKRHLARVIVGIGIMFIFSKARFARVVRLGRPLLLFSFVALIVVLLPGIGGEANGAQRWLSLGPVSFQPSELARFALLLWLVDTLVSRRNTLDRFQEGFVPIIVPVAAVVVLIMVEDFSTAIAVALICAGLIVLAGARLIHFGAIAAAAVPLAWIAMMGSEYRRARILAFFEGGSDLQGSNYQVWQSLIALGDGGLFGKGLGHSAQKLRFLPEPFNDFIFSIIGEELGFIGAIAVLILILALVLRGFKVARAAGSATGALLAAGVSLTIGVYALVNIGVVTSLLPATGLALPFISYGGS